MPKKMVEIETKFYSFRQNNSGGSFYGPTYVIIEARSATEANSVAEEKAGVYFSGRGDCRCCGKRWYEVSEDDGDDVPSLMKGAPIDTFKDTWADPKYYVKVYYFDGSTKRYVLNKKTKKYEETDEEEDANTAY